MIQIPGFIDLHTHTRYPDNNEFPFEDIDHSAINGGFSTLLAMPNSEIPIDSINNLKIAQKIDQKMKTKVHRVGALTKTLEGKELVNYREFIENGITIFSDDGKSLINDDLAEEAFKEISNLGGAIFQHCEKSCHSSPGDIAPPNADNGLIPIDNDEELEVLERDINLSQKYGTRYHAQHLSTYESVQIIKKAKEEGLPVTCEVTPHHILLNNENLDTNNGLYKMYPPIRTEKDREGLVEGLKSEIIDIIATDHAPHRPETKNVSFKDANRGVVGLESAFPLIYSSKIFELEEILRFMVINPTKILQELGYKTLDTFNTWKKSRSIFNTRSFYKNSLFENENIDIERVLSNV